MTKDYYMKRQEMIKQRTQVSSELRRKIRGVLRASGKAMSVPEISEALPNETQRAIQKELYALARHPMSDLYHNANRGPSSRYSLGLIMLDDQVEE